MAGPSTLCVIVPCFNEIEALPALEAALFQELQRIGSPFEVVAVDDGSTDGTAAALRQLALRRSEVAVLEHPRNLGLGAAVRTGIKACTGDWIAVLDADLTFHPRQLKGLLEAQRATGADCVSGSPYMEGGRLEVPWGRRLPSLTVNGFYRLALDSGLTAFTPLFRLYRAAALKDFPLDSSGFEINTEILARFLRKGLKVVEVPVTLTERVHGRSKIRPLRELARHAVLALRLLAGRS